MWFSKTRKFSNYFLILGQPLRLSTYHLFLKYTLIIKYLGEKRVFEMNKELKLAQIYLLKILAMFKCKVEESIFSDSGLFNDCGSGVVCFQFSSFYKMIDMRGKPLKIFVYINPNRCRIFGLLIMRGGVWSTHRETIDCWDYNFHSTSTISISYERCMMLSFHLISWWGRRVTDDNVIENHSCKF